MTESEALIHLLNHLHQPEAIPPEVWSIVAPLFEGEDHASIDQRLAEITMRKHRGRNRERATTWLPR